MLQDSSIARYNWDPLAPGFVFLPLTAKQQEIRFIPDILIAVFIETTNKHKPLQWHFIFQKGLALPYAVTDFVSFTHIKNI